MSDVIKVRITGQVLAIEEKEGDLTVSISARNGLGPVLVVVEPQEGDVRRLIVDAREPRIALHLNDGLLDKSGTSATVWLGEHCIRVHVRDALGKLANWSHSLPHLQTVRALDQRGSSPRQRAAVSASLIV